MKRYDWAWLGKISIYGIALLGLIYFGISTLLAMAGCAPAWTLWQMMIRR